MPRHHFADEVVIASQDPNEAPARAMLDALWDEIQRRYGFTAPNGIHPSDFIGPRGGFWVAFAGDSPIGSIGLRPLSEEAAEVDAMYVAPLFRGAGVAQRLMRIFEEYARDHGFAVVRLRAGEPQPEAVRFYEKTGFRRIPSFGKWVGDDTAWCFEKELAAGSS